MIIENGTTPSVFKQAAYVIISGLMKDKELGVVWKPNLDTMIGIVAVETIKNEWQAYMGVCEPNKTREYAIGKIIAWGAKLTPKEAHGFFPQLDITKYKGYRSEAQALQE